MPGTEKELDLTSMERTRSEIKGDRAEVADEGPQFPFGLTLHLDDESIDKLGAKELPEVGTDLFLYAKVEVTEVTQHARSDGESPRRGISLQVKAMKLVKKETTDNPGKDTLNKIYDSK